MSVETNISEDLMKLVFRLTRFEMQYPEFIKSRSKFLVESEIVDSIRKKMEEKGYSKKITERVRAEFVGIDPAGIIEYDIVSDFATDEGIDVSKIMEEGRRAFFDKPKIKQALSWISTGIRHFSKGHWIPERPGDRFVSSTIQAMEQKVQDMLNAETDQYLERQLTS
ncbi:MAG: hypothetical protein QXW37_08460 [Candidatus Nitrosotenuis sp.]